LRTTSSSFATAQAEAEAVRVRARGEADATRLRADAERTRIATLSPANYVRMQALESLAKAASGSNTKLMVLPVTANGLPAVFAPFLNPFGATFAELSAAAEKK